MRLVARKLSQLLLLTHTGCLAVRHVNGASQMSYGASIGSCLGLSLAPSLVHAASATAGTALAAALASHVAQAGAMGAVAARAALLLMQLRSLLLGSILVASIGAAARYYDDLLGFLSSLPRTARTVVWALKAGAAYKHFHATAYLNGLTPQEFQDALAQLHTHWAHRLLAMCRTNGGVYVKAGQFASAFGAVPREYRTVLAQLEDRAVPQPYVEVGAAAWPLLPSAALCSRLCVCLCVHQVHAQGGWAGREASLFGWSVSTASDRKWPQGADLSFSLSRTLA